MTVPSIARVYDYMLGGKDNFAIDRQVAEMTLKIVPDVLEPGLVPLPLWRPYPGTTPQIGAADGDMAPIHRALVSGVARKA